MSHSEASNLGIFRHFSTYFCPLRRHMTISRHMMYDRKTSQPLSFRMVPTLLDLVGQGALEAFKGGYFCRRHIYYYLGISAM